MAFIRWSTTANVSFLVQCHDIVHEFPSTAILHFFLASDLTALCFLFEVHSAIGGRQKTFRGTTNCGTAAPPRGVMSRLPARGGIPLPGPHLKMLGINDGILGFARGLGALMGLLLGAGGGGEWLQ